MLNNKEGNDMEEVSFTYEQLNKHALIPESECSPMVDPAMTLTETLFSLKDHERVEFLTEAFLGEKVARIRVTGRDSIGKLTSMSYVTLSDEKACKSDVVALAIQEQLHLIRNHKD